MPWVKKKPGVSRCGCGKVGHLSVVGQCYECRRADQPARNAASHKLRYWREKNRLRGYGFCNGEGEAMCAPRLGGYRTRADESMSQNGEQCSQLRFSFAAE